MMDISELISIFCFSLHQHRTTKTNSNESDTMKISFFLSILALLYQSYAAPIEEGDEGVVLGKPVPPELHENVRGPREALSSPLRKSHP